MQLHSVLSKTCCNGSDSICRCGMLRTSRLPASAVTKVPLSEIMQTYVQTFIPLAESKNKV